MPTPGLPAFGLSEGAAWGVAYQEEIQVPAPAAGLGTFWQMDGGYLYRILAFGGKLVTDAVVGSREPFPVITDQNGNVLWGAFTGVAMPANGTYNWTFHAHQPVALAAVGLYCVFPMPDLLWPQGCKLTFNVSTMDVADQLSNLFVLVEKYPLGPKGYIVGANRL